MIESSIQERVVGRKLRVSNESEVAIARNVLLTVSFNTFSRFQVLEYRRRILKLLDNLFTEFGIIHKTIIVAA